MLHKGVHRNVILCISPLQHGVQRDEGACPPHASTAVHQEVAAARQRVALPDLLDEADERHGIGGDSMIRPPEEVVMDYL